MPQRRLDYKVPKPMEDHKVSAFLKEKGFSVKDLKVLKEAEGTVLLNGSPCFMNVKVRVEDTVTVILPEEKPDPEIVPVALPFEVVYEDEDFLVANKPAGMPVHMSFRHRDDTLANAAARYFQDKNEPVLFRPVNRLDKDTTGLIVLAKNRLASSVFYEETRQKQMKKTYLAVVDGTGLSAEGTVDLPIGRKGDSMVERCIDHANGEPAITHFKVLAENSKKNYTIVSCTLETGRTHQIRVHMQALGHPLLGDYLYHPLGNGEEAKIGRQALHAYTLSLLHPITGEEMCFAAPVPKDMRESFPEIENITI